MPALVERIKDAVKDAMRARDKARLASLRLITAEFKRIEVDERIEIDDARALSVLDKMVKQRLDSEAQYRAAGRDELAEVEAFEITVIREYLPEPLNDEALDALVIGAPLGPPDADAADDEHDDEDAHGAAHHAHVEGRGELVHAAPEEEDDA